MKGEDIVAILLLIPILVIVWGAAVFLVMQIYEEFFS